MSSAARRLQIAAASDCGRLRSRNEDSVSVAADIGVAVVADGMGGLPDGHVASREAVAAVLAHLRRAASPADRGTLEDALRVANDRVRARSQAAGVLMGTTAVVLALADRVCRIAHVGDSRGYRFRGGSLAPVTCDHSMVQELVDRGVLSAEAARASPSRNVITRALGLDADVLPDSSEFAVDPGELLLLCSDGLWDMLEDAEIELLLRRCGTGQAGVEACVDELVAAANRAGGLDNITVVLARV